MSTSLSAALARSNTVDITTYGRRSGRPRRIEIWMFEFENTFVITGTPGPRDWYANVSGDPRMIVHVNGHDPFDVEATASPVDDVAFKRRFFQSREPSWYRSHTELDRLVADAPMIAVAPVGAA